MAKKSKPGASTWDQLKSQSASDSMKNRDVFHNQQLERSKIEAPITKTSRTVLAVIIGVIVAIVAWVLLSLLQWGGTAFMAANSGSIHDTSTSSESGTGAEDWLVDTCTVTGASSTPCWTVLEDPSRSFDQEVASMTPSERSELPTTREEAAAIYEEPQWWIESQSEAEASTDGGGEAESDGADSVRDGLAQGFFHYLGSVGAWGWKIWLTLLITIGLYSVVYRVLMLNRQKQNLLRDQTDINPYEGDQHIAPPMEVATKYNIFPDTGATSGVEVSSLISHMMLSKKGLQDVDVAIRHEENVYDEDGEPEHFAGEIKYEDVQVLYEEDVLDDDDEIIHHKGDPVLSLQPVYDENGEGVYDDLGQQVMEEQPTYRPEPIAKRMPIIDEEFGEALFDASGLPKDKSLRIHFDASTIPYNPDGSNREKLGKYDTVKDVIIDDWEFPIWEKQRPAGMYIVDSAPVNTMVLAITRAGKGQTYIESCIDMWTRERVQSNMVINDPKGELLVKNYVRATVRGYEIVQFNLINSLKTDIYNPLGMAAEAARENDSTKCAMYVENIAEVFFPAGEGDDPMWSNAANNAFKRAVYGLIDFYLEEERELRGRAMETSMNAKVLDRRLDEMWGKVTLYNCYQLFVQMSSKKRPNPDVKLAELLETSSKKMMEGIPIDPEAGEFGSQEEYSKARANSGFEMWNGEEERDELSLFFSATEKLPSNTMRDLVMNADNALKTMASAEKMLASVYGIAITAMSFFTDPTISTLTSGTPNQNVDLGGLSFPRRLGVRFSPNFCKMYSIVGLQAKWSAYSDPMFSDSLGKDFDHEDTVSREGWAQYYFKGKFPERLAYIKLELRNAGTGALVRRLFFRFSKNDQTTLDGTKYVQDPVTDQKIVRNGVLTELVITSTERDERGRNVVTGFGPGNVMFDKERLVDAATDNPRVVIGKSPAIISTMVRYSEKPKAVFLVTPPHLMKYAKLILILVKQLVDLNFDRSYMTKSNQKPLYRTRFMLDELGNLQSEGNGISGFETMLSIGLGQEQQFTLILQTLQQLRDVYGESVDKIVQGNTSNIVFLKSTDDSMIDTLVKMSGVTHVARTDSKTVRKDAGSFFNVVSVESDVSLTMTTKEEPVISYNDFASLAERNSIVLRAGDSPIWNRNETILPMSWRLYGPKGENTVHSSSEYTLQTIPTLSSAQEFNVRLNQPNFQWMLEKRLLQATKSDRAREIYMEAFGYDERAMTLLDPDVLSEDIMGIIDAMILQDKTGIGDVQGAVESGDASVVSDMEEYTEASTGDGVSGAMMESLNEYSPAEVDEEAELERRRIEAKQKMLDDREYCGGLVKASDIVRIAFSEETGIIGIDHSMDLQILEAYRRCRSYIDRDTKHFSVGAGGSLMSADGRTPYITKLEESAARQLLQQDLAEDGGQEWAEEELDEIGSYYVHTELYTYLGGLPSWSGIAEGEFERALAAAVRRRDELTTI